MKQKEEVLEWCKENYDDDTYEAMTEKEMVLEYNKMNEGYASVSMEKCLEEAEELDQMEMW